MSHAHPIHSPQPGAVTRGGAGASVAGLFSDDYPVVFVPVSVAEDYAREHRLPKVIADINRHRDHFRRTPFFVIGPGALGWRWRAADGVTIADVARGGRGGMYVGGGGR
jgi:hypothetical protein